MERITMGSREIAELTNKRHDNVKSDIKKMLEELGVDILSCQDIYFDVMNRQQIEYRLTRELTDCLLCGYSAILRLKIIQRWKDLEARAKLSLPTTFSDALLLAGQQAKELERQQDILQQALPKIDFYNAVADANDAITIGEFGKLLGMGQNKLFEYLRKHQILITSGHLRNTPHQKYLDNGYFLYRKSAYRDANGKSRVSYTTLITGKGEIWIRNKFVELGILEVKAKPQYL